MADRAQVQEAFRWVAWWETSGADHLDPDQSAQARQILGDRAYQVIVESAREYNQRRVGAR